MWRRKLPGTRRRTRLGVSDASASARQRTLRGGEQGGSDVAPPPHMAWTSAPPEPAAPQSEARTQSVPRGALDAHSLAGEEGSDEMQKSTGDEDGEEEKEEQVEFAFNFPLPTKRERKPSDEEQVETKRPKSPGKQDAQQEEQQPGG